VSGPHLGCSREDRGMLAAVDSMDGATLTIVARSNTSFGIGAKVAEVLHMNASFLEEQVWSLKVETG